jgi:hypothetical protein
VSSSCFAHMLRLVDLLLVLLLNDVHLHEIIRPQVIVSYTDVNNQCAGTHTSSESNFGQRRSEASY